MQLFSLENLRIDVESTEQGEQFEFMIRELESTPFCWYHYVQSKDNTIDKNKFEQILHHRLTKLLFLMIYKKVRTELFVRIKNLIT